MGGILSTSSSYSAANTHLGTPFPGVKLLARFFLICVYIEGLLLPTVSL